MKFIATTSDKINDIQVQSGQLIFSRDDRVIYLDTDVRTSFQQIITLVSEEVRQNMTSPVQGFYFIKDKKTLWNYDGSVWSQLSGEPKENLVFGDYATFPEIGEEGVLYIDKTKFYQWDAEAQAYYAMSDGAMAWEAIAQ